MEDNNETPRNFYDNFLSVKVINKFKVMIKDKFHVSE